MKPLWTTVAVILLTGCTAAPAQPCRTVQCELDLAAASLAKTCSSDLFLYPSTRREFIDREYRYPLTNYDTYSALQKMGSRVPSPRKWCEQYAAQKYRVHTPAPQS